MSMVKSNLEQAFEETDRKGFVPIGMRVMAGLDQPLPIGHGQTISQPTTVKRMLTWLDPQVGDRILDVGSGSGWTTALLGKLVGPKGKIYAVERVPELVEFGSKNCQKARVKNAEFYHAGVVYGLPEDAPFDRILVSAAAEVLPSELIDQLRIGGRLVIPVNNDIIVITKTTKDSYDKVLHPGYVFVPLL